MDVIFDVDGTLADCEHRWHYVRNKPKNWPAFFAAAQYDTPIEPVAEVFRCMFSRGHTLLVCSGRPDNLREATNKWLCTQYLFAGKLYMRKNGDSRPDEIVKSELLDAMLADGYNPQLVVDDRLKVCNMWKARGLLLLAVNGGNDF